MMQRLLLTALAAILLGALPLHADEYCAPLMAKPPLIDGKVDPAEWADAVGFDGFAMNGNLEERRCRGYLGATETHLYCAIVSELPKEGTLLTAVDKDTPKLVFDDSVEVWVTPTPGAESSRTFQMLANSAGHAAYIAHKRGNLPEEPNWRGDYTVKNGIHDGYWHCEVSIPIAQLAPGRKAADGRWGILLCRNWKEPWGFSTTGPGAYSPDESVFTFAPGAPAVSFQHQADPTTHQVEGALIVRNPSGQDVPVKAELLLTRDVMPELREAQELVVKAGATATVPLKVKDESTKRFALAAEVTSPDGATVYYRRAYRWGPARAARWTTRQAATLPIDFQFSYYPYLNRLRVLADVSGLKKGAALDHLTFTVRKKGTPQAVRTFRMERFANNRCETVVEMPPLNGTYEIAMSAAGQGVPPGETVKSFERTVYEWEHNNLGRSTKVYPPFTPIEVQGTRVRTVLREHQMNGEGLWNQVTATGKPLLAAPMKYSAVVDGTPAPLSSAVRFTRRAGNQAVAESTLTLGPVRARAVSTWDYDGTMRVDLTLPPTGGRRLDALTLEIPLRADQATHFHAMGDGIRNTLYTRVPEGQGVVWTSEKVNVNDFPRNFCTYLYLGTPVRGLCWFAENDRGWSWDRSKPNLELVREGDRVILRVHLINKPLTVTAARQITFGLLAAPVKPKLGPWRTEWVEKRYSLLGTDINWLALGDCGSVYPAHKDLSLWQAIAEGNRRPMTDAEIEKVYEHGKPYWEPYGPGAVNTFRAHVFYNLRSRLGATMVFYYNRASFEAADEFQTFMDEWTVDDYRTHENRKSIGEIKIVPSESYIDHALWWYAKSFEVGGNRGVYWDNWFFNATFNRMMTAAYAGEDGAVMPSTGIWGLRELSKRTFQMMNERGMLPITMPHMTSTNILPMHSFATVQYDWEWHYSEGDVQNRFTRDYLLLVSNGELAGTWPVLLGDQGKQANDPWTQRTFAGVSLVHELIGGGMAQVWKPLRDPIFALLKKPGVQAYRYWDERPQPIHTDNPDLPGIVYAVKGQEALFLVTSYAEKDETARVSIDPAALGFAGPYHVTDVETGEVLPVTANEIRFPLKKHDVREVRVIPVLPGEP